MEVIKNIVFGIVVFAVLTVPHYFWVILFLPEHPYFSGFVAFLIGLISCTIIASICLLNKIAAILVAVFWGRLWR